MFHIVTKGVVQNVMFVVDSSVPFPHSHDVGTNVQNYKGTH